jgi:hypothetical protein
MFILNSLYKNSVFAMKRNSHGHQFHQYEQKLFDPQATSVNHIPTVNHDLSAPNKVLPDAPSKPIGHDFETDTMNVLDS